MKLFFTSVPILSGQLKMVCLHILFSYLAHIKPILLKSFASNFFAVTNFTVKNSGRLISISVRKVQFLSVLILSGRSICVDWLTGWQEIHVMVQLRAPHYVHRTSRSCRSHHCCSYFQGAAVTKYEQALSEGRSEESTRCSQDFSHRLVDKQDTAPRIRCCLESVPSPYCFKHSHKAFYVCETLNYTPTWVRGSNQSGKFSKFT